MTLIDTSSWIQFLRRGGNATVKQRVRELLKDGSVVTCPVVLAELWMGAGSVKDRQHVQDVLPCLSFEHATWELSYDLARICCLHGTPVPASDLLIAACAFFHGATIDAEDKHFATLESYRALLKSSSGVG